MPSIKTPIRFLEAIFLDLISIPGLFMSKEYNAKWHMKVVCPLYSKWRMNFRDPKYNGKCLWYSAWKQNKFQFSRCFGLKNWLKYYVGLKTRLEDYEKEYKELCVS